MLDIVFAALLCRVDSRFSHAAVAACTPCPFIHAHL